MGSWLVRMGFGWEMVGVNDSACVEGVLEVVFMLPEEQRRPEERRTT